MNIKAVKACAKAMKAYKKACVDCDKKVRTHKKFIDEAYQALDEAGITYGKAWKAAYNDK